MDQLLPVFEREVGSERYREYILDEATEILMIGQAFYEGSKTIFRYDDRKKLFGMAPYEIISFANKWRPLKLKVAATILCISVFSAFIFLTPIKIQGSKLIFEPIRIIKNFSNNPFDFLNKKIIINAYAHTCFYHCCCCCRIISGKFLQPDHHVEK